jgi:Cobalamin-5-phosphate synthase
MREAFIRRLGGMTGDCAGAMIEVIEALALVALVVRASARGRIRGTLQIAVIPGHPLIFLAERVHSRECTSPCAVLLQREEEVAPRGIVMNPGGRLVFGLSD